MPSVDMSTGRFTSNALDTTRKQLQHSNFRLWLQADIQSPKIDFCFTPNNGRSHDLGWTSGFDPKEKSAVSEEAEHWPLNG